MNRNLSIQMARQVMESVLVEQGLLRNIAKIAVEFVPFCEHCDAPAHVLQTRIRCNYYEYEVIVPPFMPFCSDECIAKYYTEWIFYEEDQREHYQRVNFYRNSLCIVYSAYAQYELTLVDKLSPAQKRAFWCRERNKTRNGCTKADWSDYVYKTERIQ